MEDQNPWWKKRNWEKEDKDLRDYENSKYKLRPSILDKLKTSLIPFSLHFLLGPRRVGKTTTLKLLIKELIEEGKDPLEIFYYQCDILENYKELLELLKKYKEFKEEVGIKSSLIILDEITYPREWYRALKFAIDKGWFESDVIICSGSVSPLAKKEIESFVGRRGNGRDFILMPLSFRNYLKLFNLEGEGSKNVEEAIEIAEKRKREYFEIQRMFLEYLNKGGFLGILNEREREILNWVKSDIRKIGKSEEITKAIIKEVLKTYRSLISWKDIGKKIDISHVTVSEYIQTLRDLFILRISYYIDPNGEISFAKGKKICITDPFLLKEFERWTGQKVETSLKVEGVVCEHLSRIGETYYWKNKKEIDIVLKFGNEFYGFEVKWEDLSKRVWKIGKIKAFLLSRGPRGIPISLFLASLEV